MKTVSSKLINERCNSTVITKNYKTVCKNQQDKTVRPNVQASKSILIISITGMLFLLGFINYRSRNTSLEESQSYHPPLDLNSVLNDNVKASIEGLSEQWRFEITEADYHSLKIFNEVVHKIDLEPIVLDHLEISDSKLINDKIITILTKLHDYIQQKYTSELLWQYIQFLTDQRKKANIFAEESITIEKLRNDYSYIITELLNNKKEICSPSQLYKRQPFLEQMHKRNIIDKYKQLGEIINRNLDVDALSKLSPVQLVDELAGIRVEKSGSKALLELTTPQRVALIAIEHEIDDYLHLLWNYCIRAQRQIVDYTLLKVIQDNSETLTFKDVDKYLKEPIPDVHRNKFTDIKDYKLAKLAQIEENRIKLFQYNFKSSMSVTYEYPKFDDIF